jgi:hypothetical protein
VNSIQQTTQKIIAGGSHHKSRFHDEKGNLIDGLGLLYLPHCLMTTFLRISMGYRPVLPWLGYRAIQQLNHLIQPDWKMIEFGSGLSTVWFSQRCRQVVSVENCAEWHDKVSQDLHRRNIKNVEYLFKTQDDYSALPEYKDEQFEFILVDGSERAKCAATAVKRLKPGGYIYLDNSDKHSTASGGDTRVAEQILLDAAYQQGGEVEYFVDFLPTYFTVIQGMLVRL